MGNLLGSAIDNLDGQLNDYLITALWSSTDSDCIPLDDNYDISDIDESVVSSSRADLQRFYDIACIYLNDTDKNWGHDFWLTRNHHGSGFWGGDYENGDTLSDICKEFDSVDLYVGNDGKIYI